jgi:hypothetical protein
MPRSWLILLVVVSTACRSPVSGASPVGGTPPSPHVEVWVDGSTPESGEGTRARPFRSLPEALAGAGAVTVHLAPGRYPGPFVLPEGIRLEGAGAATVLRGEGPETLVRARGDAVLTGLVLEGGGWGLEGGGALRLEEVRFTGQREGGVRMREGRLVARASTFEAARAEAVGVSLEGTARAEVRDSAFSGPYRDGVLIRGGAEAVLEGLRFQGPATAVEQQEGRTTLRRVSVEGGRGPAVWVVEGAMTLEAVAVTGHEFGLAANRAEVDVRGFTSVGAARAGLAVLSSRGGLEDVVVRGSGRYGALQLVDSDLTLKRFRVEGADAYGVQATNGRLKASQGTLTGLRSTEGLFGDGLHLRGVVAEVERLEVRDVVGAGVLAAQGAQVTLRDVTLSGCQQAGVAVESHGSVTARGLEVRGSGGPALAALRDGVLRVESLTASGNKEGLLWADCEGETQVHLGRYHSDETKVLAAPCVTKLPLPPGEGRGEGAGNPSSNP